MSEDQDVQTIEGIEFLKTLEAKQVDEIFNQEFQLLYHPDWRFQSAFGANDYSEGNALSMGGAMCMVIGGVLSTFTDTGQVMPSMVEELGNVITDLCKLQAHLVAVGIADGTFTFTEEPGDVEPG